MKIIACPLCGRNKLSKYVDAPNSRENGTGKVDKCNDCGMLFTNPLPEHTMFGDDAQPVAEFTPEILNRQQDNAPLVLRLLSNHTNGRRMFDFGCGNGALVKYALDAGWDAKGLDIWKPMIDAGNKFFNFTRLSSESLDTYVPKHIEKYDAIVAWQVFEHVYEPVYVAKQLLPLLVPGGIFLIDVPNASQLGEWKSLGSTLHPNSQWNHFTTDTLSSLFERIGCEVIYRSGAPSLLSLWKRLRFGDPLTLSLIMKRILPSIGSGACVIGRKQGQS
jgi:SAM-dependent methyltransferase